MTVEELVKAFEACEDDYLKYSGGGRPDLQALILLDTLVPGNNHIMSGATHEQVWLEIDLESLAQNITLDQVRQLVQCGVMLDKETESLSMFA